MSKKTTQPNQLDEDIDFESEHALLLDEAYKLGEYRVKNGCLIPLVKKLDSLISKAQTEAKAEAYKDIKILIEFSNSGVLDVIKDRLEELNKEVDDD